MAGEAPGGAGPARTPAFIPLEANPEVMSSLLHKMGLSQTLQMHDVYSLTEPELLAFVPRPALALLLVFPVSAVYESHRLAEDATVEPYSGHGGEEPVMWFRQTIRNACGLMGLLHAVYNGPARGHIESNSALAKFLESATPLRPAERSKLLEKDMSIASSYETAATDGDTVAPAAADDVDLHYVCFVKTDGPHGGDLWELDGRRKGPIKRGSLDSNEDVLSQKALTLGPLKFLGRESADLRFSCVALSGSLD